MRPLHVGERVGITGRRLISCTPKETRVLAIRDLRMVRFAAAGSTVRVQGKVVRRRAEPGRLVLEVELRSTVDGVLTVGPGLGVVALPR
ncbi:hypothetical protein [Streptomyces sp. NPDC057363]|uniref:hypothetical protein n=1 Tax=Streptomyces sp. NPDC057363 TaxID=3346107 RepID=UPI0036339D5D